MEVRENPLLEVSLNEPGGMFVNLSNDKIYWTDQTARVIARANLDGTGEPEF